MNELDNIVSRAQQALSDSQALLRKALEDSNPDNSAENSTSSVQILQLLLQYRLDTQDALATLLQLDHGLLLILGIEPHQTCQINLERMKFALGNDDLRHILYSLSQLVNSLSRIAYRHQQRHAKLSAQQQSSLHAAPSHTKIADRLQKDVVLQKLFISSLTNLNHRLEEGDKTAEIGPVLDHIMALRGPVSQFFQAVQNGLELTHELYEKTYITIELDNTLEALLQQTALVLKQISPMYQPQHFFTPAKVYASDQLEQQASIKRLKPFFHH